MRRHAAVLSQLLTDQWLMSYEQLMHLVAHMHRLTSAGDTLEREEKPIIESMNFYNEDMQRINPGSVGDIPQGSIAEVKIVGPLMKYWNWYYQGADEVVAQLDYANRLTNVSAIIANIDGPGGQASAIPPFIEFGKRKQKPVIALIDRSLSLHKWVADAIADHQMADNNITARIGSIGVVSSWVNAKKYYEEMGIIFEEVYSDLSGHKNEFWRLFEQDPEKAKELLRERELNPMAKQFQDFVRSKHQNLKEDTEGLLTGRTFNAEDAVSHGIIHSIGNMKQAMLLAQTLAA